MRQSLKSMKILSLTLIIILFSSLQFFAQDTSGIYVSEDGNIYVNRNYGYYFKVSTSKDKNSKHWLLVSHTTPNNTNPLYFSKEGLNYVLSPWAVDTITKKVVRPKFNIVFEIYADGKAPETKIHNNIVAYDRGDSLFFGKDLRIWINAKDNLSGINKIFFSVNSDNFEEYNSDTLAFDTQGEYFLKYYSVDNVGNKEKIHTEHFFIDTSRPLTNLKIIGPHIDNIVSPKCKVSLKPKDAFSGNAKTYYYIDAQSKKIYTRPIDIASLTEGRHVLHYYSVDKVENKENQNDFEFYLDKTPPIVMTEVIGDYLIINGKKYTSGRSQIQLNAIDNKAGVKNIYYSFDGKNWTEYTEPIEMPENSKKLNLYYYAVDNIGNTSKGNVSENASGENLFLAELDLLPPNITYSFSGSYYEVFDTVFISPKTKINLKITDSQSGVASKNYQIDDKAEKNYNSPFSIDSAGYHTVLITASDNVNNLQTESFSVFVDKRPPDIKISFSTKSFSKDGKIHLPRNAKIFISASDKETNVQKIVYQLNNGTPKLYTGFLTFSQKGAYNMKVEATDLFGNKSEKLLNFVVE